MNKNILFFIGGLLTGAAGGFFAGKYFYEKKANDRADQQIQEMEDYYEETYGDALADRYKRESSDEVEVNPVEDDETTNTGREDGVLSPERREEIKRNLVRNHEQTTNYAAMYRQKNGASNAEEEFDGGHPPDSDEDEDEIGNNIEEDPPEEPAETDAEEEFIQQEEERQRNKQRSPRLISEDSLGDIPGYYSQEILLYYVLDETMVTEDDDVIDDYHQLLGDCMEKYNFIDNDDENVIFVRNFQTDTVYEVRKVNKAWNN